MASVIYTSFWDDMARGNINASTASIKIALTTSGYTEAKATHTKRSDVTSEVAAGNGYTTGGAAVAAMTITKDTANNRITFSIPGATWTTSAGQTLTARKAVIYAAVGTAATDQLIAVVDFGTDQVASNGGALTLSASTITLQN